MTVMVVFKEGFSKLYLDVFSVSEIDGGMELGCPSGAECIPSESISDFRVSINQEVSR